MRRYKQLTLAQLRSFSAVCRLGTYAAAARELLLTSPAIWEQMKGLERHYGKKLLLRQGNGIVPTADGQQLLAMIRPVLAGLDSTREALLQHGGARPQSLTIATNLRVLAEEISQGLSVFQRDNPGIRLHLVFTGNDVHERIESGQADVGFTLEPGPEQDYGPTIDYQPAGEVDYLLITPRRHPLSRVSSLRIKHLARYPLVLGESAAYSRRRVEEVLHRHHLSSASHVAVETSSDEYTLACVRAGMGVGITIGAGRGLLFGGLAVRSLRRWFGTARLGFVWRRGAFISPAQRELAAAIRSVLRSKPNQPRGWGIFHCSLNRSQMDPEGSVFSVGIDFEVSTKFPWLLSRPIVGQIGQFKSKSTGCTPMLIRTNHINSAVIACLEHVATSTAPPGAGAADFLLRLLDDQVFTIDEVDEIAAKVSIIINGIVERGQLSRSSTPVLTAEELAHAVSR